MIQHSKEILTQQNSPFTNIEIPEQDLGYLSQAEALEYLLAQLQQHDSYDPQSLYCGFDGKKVRLNGSFGNRTQTWAVDEATFRRGVVDSDKTNSTELNPIKYASTAADELPAIVILDQSMFEPIDQLSTYEWKLKSGFAMDDAVQAVVYLTH